MKTAVTGPITATDDELRAALDAAEFPSLLSALALLTGDLGVLRAHLMPDPLLLGQPQAGLTPEQLEEARALAFDVLVRHRDAGSPPHPPVSDDDLFAMMSFSAARTITRDYLGLLREELALGGEDRRAPTWRRASTGCPDATAPFTAIIVGAGMSGLLAAHRLEQAGVKFTILEKNDDVGGTWLENVYPGCRVDVPNHSYSYSFAQRLDWPQVFSTQGVLLDYFRTCATELGLRDRIRFGTEVTSAEWDEPSATWTVRTRSANGSESVQSANVMIVAVGQLNRPKMPDIAGMDRFQGATFHSAVWDRSVDLTEKRVAVIGTGCSACQFVPHVAEQAADVTVFQRTAPWLAPTPDYHDTVPEGLQWLFRHVPTASEWYRFFLFWQLGDGALLAAAVDPAYAPYSESVGLVNDEARKLLVAYLEEQFADRPDLLAKVVPNYPIAAKRGVRDNGVWASTLKRDHVHLVTEKISEITATGVTTADGLDHAVDVIIYGTGFEASEFLTPMRVIGRDGVDLHAQWDGNARAYMGLTVPHFPNMFLLYGPNTNIVVNGSIIFFSECEVRYLVESIGALLASGHRSMDVKQTVHDAYNERIDEGNRHMAWGVANVSTWYKNAKGHVAQNWPFSLLEYWTQTLRPDLANYDVR